MAHYHLGWLLKLTGHYAEARQHYEQALPILESRLGPDSPRVAWCLNDFRRRAPESRRKRPGAPAARALARHQGKGSGPPAPGCRCRAEQPRRHVLGMGRYDESKASIERTLAIRRRRWGLSRSGFSLDEYRPCGRMAGTMRRPIRSSSAPHRSSKNARPQQRASGQHPHRARHAARKSWPA